MSKIVDYRIVISENASTCERRAASFLRTNIKLVCGKTLEIVKDSEKPEEWEILTVSSFLAHARACGSTLCSPAAKDFI